MPFGNFKSLFCLFFVFNFGFSQNLEDQIYNELDTFIAKPSKENLEKLALKNTFSDLPPIFTDVVLTEPF